MGLYSWRLKYSSDLPEPMFYIYLDGNLIAETQQTEYSIAIGLDGDSVIEVLDDPDTPLQIFPGKVRLGWFFVEGTDYYRIDEYVDSAWLPRYRMPENGGYMSWRSRFLEDGQTHLFRIVPVGTNGNEGTQRQFSVLMCRRPDVPDVNYSYQKADYQVTGSLTPDATGNYFVAGTYNLKKYYRRADGAYYIWWYAGPLGAQWVISNELGVVGWLRGSMDIEGPYIPYGGGTSGTATVSAGDTGDVTIEEN